MPRSGRLPGMAQTPGDNKNEPSLELPSLSLPGLGRRRRRQRTTEEAAPREVLPERPVEDPAPADVPVGDPAPAPRTDPLHHPPAPAEQFPVPGAEEPTQEDEPAAGRRVRVAPRLALPAVPGRVAAAIAGLLVGLTGSLSIYGAIAGCKEVRGVSSCGGAPGFFILVAVLALCVLLGMVLLQALRVGDPGSTSFLAVGVVTVGVMLVLLDVVFSPWMFVVIPLLSAAAFLLSHWVTTRFEDEPGRRDWT